jgi:hypothetical protein
MKKLLLLLELAAIAGLSSTNVYASGGHDKGHHKHHGHHYEQADYYPQPAPNYYPQQAPRQTYQDPRSHQGLAGGVVGSVLGYELGNGNPVATGLGAAAGSYLGNGIAGQR